MSSTAVPVGLLQPMSASSTARGSHKYTAMESAFKAVLVKLLEDLRSALVAAELDDPGLLL